MTSTNNTARKASEVDPANPRPENTYGHILRWREAGDDPSATTFARDVFLLAGKGEGSGDGSTVAADAAFGSPDGLWVDPDYRVWILTDGSQPVPCNNQLLVADPFTGEVRRFLSGPRGVGSPASTPPPTSATCSSTCSTPAMPAPPRITPPSPTSPTGTLQDGLVGTRLAERVDRAVAQR